MCRIVLTCLLVSTVLQISGCDSLNKLLEAQNTIAAQGQQIAALQQRVDSLEIELALLKNKVSSLKTSNTLRDWEEIAYLQPGDGGYAPIRFDLGVLTVQITNVKPYANGSKVSLNFGNPLASSITGLKLDLEWGRLDEKGLPNNDTSKAKQFTFSGTLHSGAWTTVPVVLEGIPPAELGFVRIRDVTYTGITLTKWCPASASSQQQWQDRGYKFTFMSKIAAPTTYAVIRETAGMWPIPDVQLIEI